MLFSLSVCRFDQTIEMAEVRKACDNLHTHTQIHTHAVVVHLHTHTHTNAITVMHTLVYLQPHAHTSFTFQRKI